MVGIRPVNSKRPFLGKQNTEVERNEHSCKKANLGVLPRKISYTLPRISTVGPVST
jgi:hypothetical protein